MTTKKKIIIGIILIAVIGGYFYFRGKNNQPVIPTETVKRGAVAETVSVSGELVPAEYADLSFYAVGIVDEVMAEEGDQVKKRAALASLDRTVLQSQLNDARIALAIAEEQEKLSHRESEDLKPEERKAKKLATEQAREKVRKFLAEMQENVMTSPIDGTVSRMDARVGETATVGRVVARIAKDGDFVIESRVPESDIAEIGIGMKALVTFDALRSDEVFEAEAVEIDRAATVVQDVVSYIVKFRLKNIDQRLKEGMTANIDIETARRENALTVPFRALSREGGKTYAQVRRADETFERVSVTVGVEGDEGTVEILSGLKEGDEISISAKSQ